MAVIIWPQRVLQQAGWNDTSITRKDKYLNAQFSESSIGKLEYKAQLEIKQKAVTEASSIRGLTEYRPYSSRVTTEETPEGIVGISKPDDYSRPTGDLNEKPKDDGFGSRSKTTETAPTYTPESTRKKIVLPF